MNYKAIAIGLLGKKKEHYFSDNYHEQNEKNLFNKMHSKAVDVVVGLLKYKEAIESAEGELDIISQAYCTKENENKELDTTLLLAIKKIISPILAKAKLRIEELKKEIEKYQCNTGWAESIRLGKELQSLKKKNDELIVKNTKALKYLYEFRILKDKLTVEKLVKIIEKSIIDCGSYEVFDIAQALIKDLEI